MSATASEWPENSGIPSTSQITSSLTLYYFATYAPRHIIMIYRLKLPKKQEQASGVSRRLARKVLLAGRV